MNELVKQNTELATDVGMTDEISWTPRADLTLEEYEAIGRTFQQIQHSLAWWMGDWLNYGEKKFGEVAMQAIESTGKSLETLLKWKAVAARVSREIRQKDLSWTHHFYITYASEELRGPLLEMALNMGLSSRELKDVEKLADNLIEDLIIAVEEGIERESFLNLVNKFKLGAIDKPKPEPKDDDEEDDDELPFSDLDSDDDEADDSDRSAIDLGLSSEDVFDFWENAGTALTFCSRSQAMWEGLAVRAGMDANGKLVLIWEELP